ncbi:unnamed protein product [Candida verbasci]|uniref:CAP-Gly domain-containing protein n=1 Tax=Candida verbasci TaxID=1227364 RepID=A0A9W4XGW4_9ASCO|nr:unnamed protein product [Candida verbasci]
MDDYIGLKVAIPGASGYGIIRYYGSIRNKIGTFVGIELLGQLALTRGKNSGSVDGIQYFTVEIPKSGLFLPFERLKSVNPQLENLSSLQQQPSSFQQNQVQIQEFKTPERKPLTTYSNARMNMLNENISKSEDMKDIEINELKRIIKEKDKKLENFNIQRQEWRAAMDELVNVQTEGMTIYEEKVSEFEMEIEKLNNTIKEKDAKLKEFEEVQLNDKINNINLDEVEELKKELDKRPKLEDFKELQQSLDEIEAMYKTQLHEKDEQIKELTNKLNEEKPSIPVNEESKQQPLSLPIYTPPVLTDPSFGKNDWCGLCERDGHSSINCPYENDIF